MSLKSMTGYGRSDGQCEGATWVWEGRSVNGKSLDIRLRLPPGFESLEAKIRKVIADSLQRGNLQITLAINSSHALGGYKINHEWIDALMNDGDDIAHKYNLTRSSLVELYQITGVIIEGNVQSASDPQLKIRNEAILSNLKQMLGALIKARISEGAALEKVMLGCTEKMEALTAKARTCESALPTHIKQKLAAKIEELLGENLDKDRFAQEAALLAVKADVREELDRLDAHIIQAKALLISQFAIGRKLDFLSQEFIREINTLCAKSIDIDLTKIGLEMKSIIEQFREQAANIE